MLSRYLSPVVEIGMRYMLNVCVLSRYLSPVIETGMCYMLNVCVLSRYLSPVIEVLIILSVMLDVKCLCVVSLPQSSSRDWYVLYVKCFCVVSLPQSSNRRLDYPLCDVRCKMFVCCLVTSVQ